MRYLNAMLAVVVLALVASSQASAVAVCTSCYEGDQSLSASGLWGTSNLDGGSTDGTSWDVTGLFGEPTHVSGPIGDTGTVEWRAQYQGGGSVIWQVRHWTGSGAGNGPSWHVNTKGDTDVSAHFSSVWPLNQGDAGWVAGTFHTYRMAWKPNGSNWDWYFSFDGAMMDSGTNVSTVYHASRNELLMGTADANTGLALDYFRVVAGKYVPAGEAIIIPEPATLGLVAIGGALMLRRRRKSA